MSRCLFWIAIAVACNTLATTLSWATPMRNIPGDLAADRILGQPDFSQINFNETTANGLFDAYCVVVDNVPGHNMMYVYDCGNNRVLGVTLVNGQATNGQGATLVLGQPDFIHSACNGDSNWQNYPNPPIPNASCLCGNSYTSGTPAESGSSGNMAVDNQGNLYVPDFYNNRVLRYDWPISSGQSASHVWGQTDFSGYQANQGGALTSMTLAFILPSHIGGGMWANLYLAAVGTDSWGNLWVADAENNRVLRFPNLGGVPDDTADVVLGQNDFTSSSPTATGPTDRTHMDKPTGVRVDGQGNVYVTDLPPGSTGYGCVGRVLVYRPTGTSSGVPTYTNGQAAAAEFGQANLTRPVGLEFDPTVAAPSVGLWVTDSNQIIEFLVSLTPTITGTASKSLLKHAPQASNTGCGDGGVSGDLAPGYFTDNYGNTTSNWNTCDLQGSLGVDSSGNIYLGGKNIQDVWRFPAPIPTPRTGYAHSADVRIFKPAQNGLFNTRGTKGMYYAIGLAIGEAQGVTQVIAADRSRLMYWNIPASGPAGFTNGQAADGTAGYSNPAWPLEQAHPELWRIATDQASSQPHLWAIWETSYIQVYNLPLHNGDAAVATLTPPFSVLGGGTVNFSHTEGIAVDPTGTYLWLSDQSNNRALRVRNPLTAPVVDIVLGQTNLSTTGCNQGGTTSVYCGPCSKAPTASSLFMPGAVVLDRQGNLFISDDSLECWGNNRLLRWNAAQLPASPSTCQFAIPAAAVYGRGGSFTSTQCSNSAGGVCGPWEPAINSDDSIMVVGMNTYTGSHFPLVMRNPLLGDNPIATLEDYSPQAYCSVFDDSDNLYVADLTRSRVMIYLQPYTPVVTFTPTATPTGTWYTPTATNTPTVTQSFTPTLTVPATPGPCSSAWHLNGNAGAGSSAVTVTPNLGGQDGSAWNSVAINLNSDFDMVFKVFLGSNANGSDGMGFVLQSQGIHALGTGGGGLGFGSVSGGALVSPSVDIEFDTHQNTELGDPAYDHLSLEENGQLSSILAGPVQASVTSATIKDGVEHNFEVAWNATSHTLTVYFDASQRLTFTQDIVNTVFGGNPTVLWGFTGGTGGDYNLQYFKPAACPPTATITPTPTFTVTATMTPTYSTTATVTDTLTAAPSLSLTVSPIPTGTPTETASATSTASMTASPSLTATPTPTASSAQVTWSPTNTLTASHTPADTATITATSTRTGTPTATFTNTLTQTPTSSMTFTRTPTSTSTVTYTSTPGISLPYPNPVWTGGTLSFNYSVKGPSEMKWAVYTVAFRKIFENSMILNGQGTVVWDLRDSWGKPVANGLYYIRVEVPGFPAGKNIFKLIVLR